MKIQIFTLEIKLQKAEILKNRGKTRTLEGKQDSAMRLVTLSIGIL